MDLVEKVSGLFERRFVLNALLPSAIFWGLLAGLVVLTRTSPAKMLATWDAQGGFLKSLETVVFAIVILAMAGLLSASATSIVRLFEGYWSPPLSWVFLQRATAWHLHRLQELSEAGNDAELYYSYPPVTRPNEVMPTRLGNILKCGEVYADLRYGIDPIIIWPRLYSLLSETALAGTSTSRAALEFHLAASVTSALFAVVAGTYLLLIGGTWWLFLVCFWGGFSGAWIAYETALPAAQVYSEQVKVVFDNCRNDLVLKMRLPLPVDPNEEFAMWREISTFFYRNVREHPDAWKYTASSQEDAK
jgi:hypothetical protein